MTVDEWIEQTKARTQAFTETPDGKRLRSEAAQANPSWKHLSEYGQTVWLCQYFNPYPK